MYKLLLALIIPLFAFAFRPSRDPHPMDRPAKADNFSRKMIFLEGGKLQYEILKQGDGDSVESYHSPLIRCKGRFANGHVFKRGVEEEVLCLSETIPGLRKGIVGMKEGEKRILYIEPELGYRRGHPFYSNESLTFEVQLIKADASSEAHMASQKENLPFSSDLDASPSYYR